MTPTNDTEFYNIIIQTQYHHHGCHSNPLSPTFLYQATIFLLRMYDFLSAQWSPSEHNQDARLKEFVLPVMSELQLLLDLTHVPKLRLLVHAQCFRISAM
jgi:hypothetical protein